MASTATTRLRLEKMGTGDDSNTWGATLNSSVFDLLDEAIAGVESYALSGSKTLSSTNYASDESRPMVQWITSGTGGAVTIPGVEKVYVVRNDASGAVTFAPSGGTTASVAAGETAIVWSDGTDCYQLNGLSVTLASGMSTFLGTPSSANLKATVTDETGSGALVFAESPTLVTPALGTPASGTLTNCTTATASTGDNDTSLASTAFVQQEITASGWQLVSTTNTTSGTTITITDDVSGYQDINLVFEGVGHDSGSTNILRFALYDGSSWATANSAASSGITSGVLSGGIFIPHHRANAGGLTCRLAQSVSSPGNLSALAVDIGWGVTGGIDGIRFTWSAGAAFDAGTIKLYGRT